MTSDETRTYGFGPHLTRQPLLEAMLCLWLSLVFRAVSTLRMIRSFFHRDWHTKDASDVLPSATSSNPLKETTPAETPGLSSSGNGLQAVVLAKAGIQTPRNARTSYTRLFLLSFRAQRSADPEPRSHKLALSPLVPMNVGIQGRPRTLFHLAASTPRLQHNRSRLPTVIPSLSKDVGMSGMRCTT